jgi:hypothetical protein
MRWRNHTKSDREIVLNSARGSVGWNIWKCILNGDAMFSSSLKKLWRCNVLSLTKKTPRLLIYAKVQLATLVRQVQRAQVVRRALRVPQVYGTYLSTGIYIHICVFNLILSYLGSTGATGATGSAGAAANTGATVRKPFLNRRLLSTLYRGGRRKFD